MSITLTYDNMRVGVWGGGYLWSFANRWIDFNYSRVALLTENFSNIYCQLQDMTLFMSYIMSYIRTSMKL